MMRVKRMCEAVTILVLLVFTFHEASYVYIPNRALSHQALNRSTVLEDGIDDKDSAYVQPTATRKDFLNAADAIGRGERARELMEAQIRVENILRGMGITGVGGKGIEWLSFEVMQALEEDGFALMTPGGYLRLTYEPASSFYERLDVISGRTLYAERLPDETLTPTFTYTEVEFDRTTLTYEGHQAVCDLLFKMAHAPKEEYTGLEVHSLQEFLQAEAVFYNKKIGANNVKKLLEICDMPFSNSSRAIHIITGRGASPIPWVLASYSDGYGINVVYSGTPDKLIEALLHELNRFANPSLDHELNALVVAEGPVADMLEKVKSRLRGDFAMAEMPATPSEGAAYANTRQAVESLDLADWKDIITTYLARLINDVQGAVDADSNLSAIRDNSATYANMRHFFDGDIFDIQDPEKLASLEEAFWQDLEAELARVKGDSPVSGVDSQGTESGIALLGTIELPNTRRVVADSQLTWANVSEPVTTIMGLFERKLRERPDAQTLGDLELERALHYSIGGQPGTFGKGTSRQIAAALRQDLTVALENFQKAKSQSIGAASGSDEQGQAVELTHDGRSYPGRLVTRDSRLVLDMTGADFFEADEMYGIMMGALEGVQPTPDCVVGSLGHIENFELSDPDETIEDFCHRFNAETGRGLSRIEDEPAGYFQEAADQLELSLGTFSARAAAVMKLLRIELEMNAGVDDLLDLTKVAATVRDLFESDDLLDTYEPRQVDALEAALWADLFVEFNRLTVSSAVAIPADKGHVAREMKVAGDFEVSTTRSEIDSVGNNIWDDYLEKRLAGDLEKIEEVIPIILDLDFLPGGVQREMLEGSAEGKSKIETYLRRNIQRRLKKSGSDARCVVEFVSGKDKDGLLTFADRYDGRAILITTDNKINQMTEKDNAKGRLKDITAITPRPMDSEDRQAYAHTQAVVAFAVIKSRLADVDLSRSENITRFQEPLSALHEIITGEGLDLAEIDPAVISDPRKSALAMVLGVPSAVPVFDSDQMRQLMEAEERRLRAA